MLRIAYFHAYLQIYSLGKKADGNSGKSLEKEKQITKLKTPSQNYTALGNLSLKHKGCYVKVVL